MRAFVSGIGVLGPGLPSWEAAVAILSGANAYVRANAVISAAAMLPPAERRRIGLCVKVALAVGQATLQNAGGAIDDLSSVFTSSGGDGEVIHQICATLATADRDVSPTHFHNSVHNAAAGYWGIASHWQEASTSLCGHDASFAAGLLEAMAQVTVDNRAVLLVAYDVPYPEPLRKVRPIVDTFGVGMILSPTSNEATIARLEMALTLPRRPATTMLSPDLERLRQGIPAARALPLLAALAKKDRASIVLDYVAEPALVARIEPI